MAPAIPPRSHSFNNEESNVVKSDGQWATFDNVSKTNTIGGESNITPFHNHMTFHHKAETISEFPMSTGNIGERQEDFSNTIKFPNDSQSPAVQSNASEGPFAKSLQKKQWEPFSVLSFFNIQLNYI